MSAAPAPVLLAPPPGSDPLAGTPGTETFDTLSQSSASTQAWAGSGAEAASSPPEGPSTGSSTSGGPGDFSEVLGSALLGQVSGQEHSGSTGGSVSSNIGDPAYAASSTPPSWKSSAKDPKESKESPASPAVVPPGPVVPPAQIQDPHRASQVLESQAASSAASRCRVASTAVLAVGEVGSGSSLAAGQASAPVVPGLVLDSAPAPVVPGSALDSAPAPVVPGSALDSAPASVASGGEVAGHAVPQSQVVREFPALPSVTKLGLPALPQSGGVEAAKVEPQVGTPSTVDPQGQSGASPAGASQESAMQQALATPSGATGSRATPSGNGQPVQERFISSTVPSALAEPTGPSPQPTLSPSPSRENAPGAPVDENFDPVGVNQFRINITYENLSSSGENISKETYPAVSSLDRQEAMGVSGAIVGNEPSGARGVLGQQALGSQASRADAGTVGNALNPFVQASTSPLTLFAASLPAPPPLTQAGIPTATGLPGPTVVQAGPEMANQMVTVLAGLAAGPDGSHSVVLQLQPDGLGLVQASVTTSPGSVTVHLSAQSDAGYDALRQSLPQLQTMLSNGGSFGATVLLSRQYDGADGGKSQSGRGGTNEHDSASGDSEVAEIGLIGNLVNSSDHTIDIHI
jgi:flagellar hook-length control protein FliK